MARALTAASAALYLYKGSRALGALCPLNRKQAEGGKLGESRERLIRAGLAGTRIYQRERWTTALGERCGGTLIADNTEGSCYMLQLAFLRFIAFNR